MVAPSTHTQLEVAFRPVLAEEATVPLVLKSEELGVFNYELRLSSSPAGPSQSLFFDVPLGGRETRPFRFMHFLHAKADYAVSWQSPDQAGFESEAALTAQAAGPEGLEVSLDVHFEPTRVGEAFRNSIIVKSPTAGEFVCPVVGRCQAPKPQGPIILKGALLSILAPRAAHSFDVHSSTAAVYVAIVRAVRLLTSPLSPLPLPSCISANTGVLPFKNVFSKDTDFAITVDNPAFVVAKVEKIGAKKTNNIKVDFKPPAGVAAPARHAKMTVTCAEAKETPWVFYLQAPQ